jgi:hypothetical protein
LSAETQVESAAKELQCEKVVETFEKTKTEIGENSHNNVHEKSLTSAPNRFVLS